MELTVIYMDDKGKIVNGGRLRSDHTASVQLCLDKLVRKEHGAVSMTISHPKGE